MKNIFESLRKKFCRHKVIVLDGKIEDGEMTEPGKEPRQVKLRMVYTRCSDCDRIFKMSPMGIAEDAANGIHDDRPNFEKTVEVPADVRKEVLAQAG